MNNTSDQFTMDNINTSSGISPDPDQIYLVPVVWDWRSVMQLILAIIGILDNSLIIHLYRSTKALKKNTTNTFIVALAIADLVTSIALIPHPMLSTVPENALGALYCRVVYSANIMWISIVASIFTLTALAVERYTAVAYPSRYKIIFTKTNTKFIIFLIWLSGLIINTFEYYGFFVIDGQCVYQLPSPEFQMFLGVAVFLIEYLIPILIMLATSIRTVQILNSKSAALSNKSDEQSMAALSLLRLRRRVVNMLVIVIITFIICWSPDQFAYLVFNLGLVPVHYLFGTMYRAFVALAFANSCLNPFIYMLTNKNFRRAFRVAFLRGQRRVGPSSDDVEMTGNSGSATGTGNY